MSSSSPIDHSPAETMAKTSTAQDSQDEEERRQKQARKDLVCQVFTLAWQHPIWQNVLSFLTLREKMALRLVNKNMLGVVVDDFQFALNIRIDCPLRSNMYKTVAGINARAKTLTARKACKTHILLKSVVTASATLVSVDLSFASFFCVKTAVGCMVSHCRQLKKLVLRNLAHDMHRRMTNLDETWAFSGLVRHPLPSLEYLDIAGNGSQGLTPAIFATLVSKHPRLQTLYVDSGTVFPKNRIFKMFEDCGLFPSHFAPVMGHEEERTGDLIRNQLSLIHVLSTWLGSESLQKLVLCHAPKQSYLKWNYNPSGCCCNSPSCRAPGKTGPTLCWSCPLTRCPLGPHPVLTVLTCIKESTEEKEYSSAATAGKAAATSASPSSPSSSSSRRPQITWTNCWSLNHPNTSLQDTGLSDRVTLLKSSLCQPEPMNDDCQPKPMEDDCQHVLFTSDDAEDASRQEVRRREAKERNQNKPKRKEKRRAHQDPLTLDLYGHPFFGFF